MTVYRESWERVVAGVASVVFTASILALFLRPIQSHHANVAAEDVIEVVFVHPAARRPAIQRTSGQLRRAVRARKRAVVANRTVVVPPSTTRVPVPLDLSVRDDAWSKPGSGSWFRSNEDRIAGKPTPEFVAQVDHLRVKMKAPITVERVLREAGRALGFWPPGYTDDPCPGIAKLADYYRAHPPSRIRLLEDAMDLESKCKKASSSP